MPTITIPAPPEHRLDALAGHPGLLDEYRRAWALTHRTPTKFARRALADFVDHYPDAAELFNPRHPAGLDVEVLDNAPDVGPRYARDAARARGTADALDAMVRCQRCGHELDNPLSKRRKIGPDCWARGHRAVAVEWTDPPSNHATGPAFDMHVGGAIIDRDAFITELGSLSAAERSRLAEGEWS